MKFQRTAIAILLAAILAGTVGAEETQMKSAGAEALLIQVEAKVVAIDLKKREVLLADEEGNQILLHVGEEARNLPQLAVGDRVVAEYFQGLLFAVEPAGTGKPMRVEKTLSDRTPEGQKPGGSVTTYVELIARVEGIDRKRRMVTLRGPKKTITIKAEEDVDLSTVHVGDLVKADFVEEYTIRIEER